MNALQATVVESENDVLIRILETLSAFCTTGVPLAVCLRSVERESAAKVAKLLQCYRCGRYVFPERLYHRTVHLYAAEAAEITHGAFMDVFGRGPFRLYDLEKCKNRVIEVFTKLDSPFPKKEERIEQAERFVLALKVAAEEEIRKLNARQTLEELRRQYPGSGKTSDAALVAQGF